MNKQKIIELIQSSQYCIKYKLLESHSESKYELLMLQRSFEIIAQYILIHEQHDQNMLSILKQLFKFPVQDLESGVEHLCTEIRRSDHLNIMDILVGLNTEDLKMIEFQVR